MGMHPVAFDRLMSAFAVTSNCPQTASLALALGAAVAALSGAWPALIGAPLGAWAVAAIAKRKIGGQTGDILGACQQCAETCALICLVAFI